MPLSTISRTQALLFSLLLVSGGTAASSTNDKAVELITVTTGAPTPFSQAPGNATLITTEVISLVAANHIQQLTERVPGVQLHRGNGQEYLPSIRSAVLTGAGACGQFLMAEEGIPLRSFGFCNVNELFDSHYEQASRVEIIRGPGNGLYGSNALTGTINLVLSEKANNQVELEAGGADYWRIKASQNYVDNGQHTGSVYLTSASDGGYRDDSGFDQYKLSVRHRYNGDTWQLEPGATLTLLDQATAGFITGLDSYKDKATARTNQDPEAFRKSQTFRAWSTFSKNSSDTQTLRITPYLRHTDMDFRLHFLPGDPLEQNQQAGVGIKTQLDTAHSDGLSSIIGIDIDWTKGALLQSQHSPTVGSAFLTETVPVGQHYDYEVEAQLLAVYGQLHWHITSDLTLAASTRYEVNRYNYDNKMLTGRTRDDGTICGFGGCRYSRPADDKNNFEHFSPKVELQYRPNDSWMLYGLVAETFRAPQTTELYRLQRAQIVADIDSVKAQSAEIGFRYTGERTKASVSLYTIKMDNVIFRDSDFFNVDSSKTRHKGLELSLRHRLSQTFAAGLSATFAEHKYAAEQFSSGIDINGNDIDTAPHGFGNLYLEWQPTTQHLLALSWHKMGKYFMDPENLHEYEGHQYFNLRGSWTINPQWQTSFRLINASDERYANRADYTRFTDERYFPGQALSLFLSVKRNFN